MLPTLVSIFHSAIPITPPSFNVCSGSPRGSVFLRNGGAVSDRVVVDPTAQVETAVFFVYGRIQCQAARLVIQRGAFESDRVSPSPSLFLFGGNGHFCHEPLLTIWVQECLQYACEDVLSSNKFVRVLEIILAIGPHLIFLVQFLFYFFVYFL